jgi:serum/glucocorticoid-regulated kinase 2
MFEMLTGAPPFYTKDRQKLYDAIKNKEVRYPSHMSTLAKQIIIKLMNKNPKKRLGSGITGTIPINNPNSKDAAPAGATGTHEVKMNEFFQTVDWYRLLHRGYVPPFRPNQEEGAKENPVKFVDKDFLQQPVYSENGKRKEISKLKS